MKKILQCTFALLFIVACKKTVDADHAKVLEDNDNITLNDTSSVNSAADAAPDCSKFDEVNAMTDPLAQYDFVVAHNAEMKKSIYDYCRIKSHKITANEYATHTAAAGTPKTTTVKLSSLLSKGSDSYVDFLQFKENSTGDIVFSKVNTFSYTPTCYAMPLFYTLERLADVDPNTDITFSKAKINNEEVIIFYTRTATQHFNYTHHPND